jgi:hypothetical protein
MIKSAIAAPEDQVRATFDRFVAAQNAHDSKAVESLLLDSPHFLWITRGTPIWGQDVALKRFIGLYDGTWRLDPEPSGLKITMPPTGWRRSTYQLSSPWEQPASRHNRRGS